MKFLLLFVTWLSLAGPAVALSFGGQIGEDTHWTLSESPVIVSTTVTVVSGAQLRIDPGVTVAFSSGASLEIRSGSLFARGLVENPVQFISLGELEGQQPASGDWGSIIFGPGTDSSSTLVEYAVVRHGHGIQVLGSAPQLNYLNLMHNAGAAIDLDLSASPHGVGLSAYDNAINGIRVPPGQIAGDVIWALRGIPYVLEEGLIRVGRPAYSLLPQALSVTSGVTVELELVIPDPAGVDGLQIDLVSSVPGVAQVPAVVDIEAGQSSATFQLEAIAPGQATISASDADFGLTTATVDVIDPPVLILEPQSPSIGIGESMLFHLTLSEPAGTGGLMVDVMISAEGIVDVPEQLFLAEGSQLVSFNMSGVSQGSVMLSLQAEGFLGVATAIEVIPPSIQLPLAVFTSPGINRRVPLSLSHPAPAGGLTVNLVTSEDDVIDLPDAVFVQADETEAEFEITGQVVGFVSVTASAQSFADSQMQVTVAELTLSLDPDAGPWLPLGTSRSYAVRLSDAAPPGGVVVSVSVGDPEIATVSVDTLIIPAGQILATDGLLVTSESIGETDLQLAFEGGQPISYPVRVTDPLEVRFSRSSVTIGRGLASYPWVLSASLWSGDESFRPHEDIALPLVCDDPDICSLHGTAVIAEGSIDTTVTLRGNSEGQSHLNIDHESLVVADQTEVTVVEPELQMQSLSGTRSVGSARDSGRLRWYVPGGTSSNYANSTMAESATLQLAIIDDQPEGLVDGIWNQSSDGQQITDMGFPAGANRSNWFYVGSPSFDGSYRVRAAIDGLVETISAEQFVLTPQLSFTRSSMVTGRGLVSYPWVLQVQREVGGSPFSGSEALQVSLACVDGSVCEVPDTVTIPANQSSTQIPVTGITLGETEITATADDHTDAAPALITVVDPELQIQSLAGTRSLGSARDSARLRWYVPEGTSSNYANSTMAITSQVGLSIVDDLPADLIDGIWDHSSAGDQIDSLDFSAGTNRSNWFYVGTPTQAGVYKVHAQIDGLAESISAEQNVLNPELSFNRSSMVTGLGLVSYPWVLVVQRMVDGSPFNGAAPLEVQLSCQDDEICQVPETVVIPANQSQIQIAVTGTGLGATTVLASAVDHDPADPATIEVVEPELQIQSLTETRSVGSVRDSSRLRWYVPGGTSSNYSNSTLAESKLVQLAIVDDQPQGLIDGLWDTSSQGELITSIEFPAGDNRSGWFYVGTPTDTGTYRVSADIAGLVGGLSGVQTVVQPELRFSRSDFVVGHGMRINNGYLGIQRVAAGSNSSTAEAVTISLSCSASEVCNIPEGVSIPAGSQQVWVPLVGTGLGATTLSATAPGHLPASPIPVTTVLPSLEFRNLSTSMDVGSQQSFRLRLRVNESSSPTGFSVVEPFEFDLSSNFPSVLGLQQSTATVTSGNTSGWVEVEAIAVGQAQITASGSGLEPHDSAVVEVAP